MFIKYVCLFVFIPYALYGSINYSGSLSKGLGAKSSSLAGAYTALANNTDAIYWNPAGIQSSEVSIFYSKYFNEVDYSWIRATFLNFGLGYMSMSIKNIMHTDEFASILDTFIYKDEVGFLSYKYDNFGINLKAIHQKAIKEYYGFGIDVSCLYKFNQLQIGIMIQDLIKSKIGTDIMATRLNLGIAYNFQNILLSSDIRLIKKIEWAIGSQIIISDSLKILGGINNKEWNIGLEIDLKSFRINYNYFPHELGNINEIDIHISF